VKSLYIFSSEIQEADSTTACHERREDLLPYSYVNWSNQK